MSPRYCPCCGWRIVLTANRPDLLAACSECGQVVQVPGVPLQAIPDSGTDSLIDWGTEENRPADDSVPLLPPALCYPIRPHQQVSSPGPYAWLSLVTIGLSVFMAAGCFRQSAYFSLPLQFITLCMSGFFLLMGVRLLYHAVRKYRRCKRPHLLSTAQLPPGADQLGIPMVLHRQQSGARNAQFLIGLLFCVGGVVVAFFLLQGEIEDIRMAAAATAVVWLMAGIGSIVTAGYYQPRRLLVYPDGFVLMPRQGSGELWHWEDIESVYLKPNGGQGALRIFSYTLRRKDGRTFAFDSHFDYVENQFGVRVQHALIRSRLSCLLRHVQAGGQAEFGSLRLSKQGLHQEERFLPWEQIVSICVEDTQVTLHKWGGGSGASWSMPYDGIPNLALFLTLASHLMHQNAQQSESALSVLTNCSSAPDSAAIQARFSNLQAHPDRDEM